MPYRGCGDGSREIQLPQRHRIMGFAAVVEKGNGGKMPYRGCREGTWGKRLPQRHRIMGFAAVVERGDGGKMPHRGLWRGFTSNADAATAANCGVCCRCGKEDG